MSFTSIGLGSIQFLNPITCDPHQDTPRFGTAVASADFNLILNMTLIAREMRRHHPYTNHPLHHKSVLGWVESKYVVHLSTAVRHKADWPVKIKMRILAIGTECSPNAPGRQKTTLPSPEARRRNTNGRRGWRQILVDLWSIRISVYHL